MRIAILGGGLAGCALAYTLKKNGAVPIIYDVASTLASGASGHNIGLYNPRLSAHRSVESDYFTAAFALARRIFPTLENIDWDPCGCLHLLTDEKQAKRLPQTLRNWGWEAEHMQMLGAKAASKIAGIPLEQDALYLPDSGVISPERLCRAYVQDVELHLNTPVQDLNRLKEKSGADAVILACSYGVKDYVPWLPLSQVRGQLTDMQATVFSSKLKCALCYGGYISPASQDGTHALGATFQRHFEHDKPMTEDNQENFQKLDEMLPQLAKGLKVAGHRAALRTMTRDYFPIVGRVPDEKNFYVSTGHGSYAIISTLASAYLLTDMILGKPFSLSCDTVRALSPERFRESG